MVEVKTLTQAPGKHSGDEKTLKKKQVLIGLLGPALDRARAGESRWLRWRPTVSLCGHEDLLIDRLELIFEDKYEKLAREVQEDIASISPETEVCLHRINWRDPWDFEEVYGALHDYAGRYNFRTDSEDYLIHITTGSHVAQICHFLLTEARYFPGRLIQSSPPPRSRPGAPGEYRIIDLDLSRYDRIASRFREERQEGLSFLKSGIETRNRRFNELIEQIERVAINSRAPLLLTGPTGAGKSKLAGRIYELKKRRRQVEGSFVEVNCATLKGEGAMSTLFGHVKGAFTGAFQARQGLLRAADGGVLFLDEIGELGLDEQAMLLRALEEKRFMPLGADKETQSDFQLIAGTNRNLQEEVGRGGFREDLMARINLWTFELPGLRDRPEDIEPNLEFELGSFAERSGEIVRFNKEAREAFLLFSVSPAALWEANFRDLNAAVTRMATLAPGGRITPAGVEEEIVRLKRSWKGEPSSGVSGAGGVGSSLLSALPNPERFDELDLFERMQLENTLAVCGEFDTLARAGRALFSESRKRMKVANDSDRLRKYLSRYAIHWSDILKLR